MMTIHSRWAGVLLVVLPLILSCEGEPAARRGPAARVDSTYVAEAVFEYDSAAFREISWPDQALALERGETVWQYSCQWCHGLEGEGKQGLLLRGDTFSTPSLLEPDWHLAGRPWELRRRIFAGSELGMPHWGLVGLDRRDVDAVARYIFSGLREPSR
ncbi:MAG: cytochrome c [Gemmatimonadetes bacterium]|nr:cytochrome c [Gemmatimonadota bacterium]NIU30031.1 cytochrome c [Gemmatimonadota bacterium]NIU34990.1 hypothetical protein [Gemmatimonadota bacterium]NIV60436.1 hypothetical protein [Gemmatimonadota bacterium]NIW63102.1 hypothetical protein [Gemmatimonadota bacterium]